MLFYYLSLFSIVDICLPFWSEWEHVKGWHFLDVIARGAPLEQDPFLSVLVSRFSFWPCIYVFSSFICWNISSICAGLCTPLITWNSFASSHPSSVKNAVGQTQVGTLLRHSQFLRSNKCANHQTQTLASWGKIQHWISFSLLTKPLLCRPRLLIQTFSMLKTFWYELIFFCFWDLASNSLLSS